MYASSINGVWTGQNDENAQKLPLLRQFFFEILNTICLQKIKKKCIIA